MKNDGSIVDDPVQACWPTEIAIVGGCLHICAEAVHFVPGWKFWNMNYLRIINFKMQRCHNKS